MQIKQSKIKSIRNIGLNQVFDLQTKNNTLIANDHIVHNCLIFQESVMDLAEIVGGFPKDKCDDVRRAIMKRDMSKGAQAIKDANDMEEAFVAGAISKGIEEKTARASYKTVLHMSGYGFNRAHATAYAIDSYLCAYLMTYHETEWLTAFLEVNSNNPDDRASAFGQIKKMGYSIIPIDINTATSSWTPLTNKQFMPSFLSCKGVGQSAIDELLSMRPYTSIENLLWNDDGTWKHSKFNKRALEALIKVGALGSLDSVGPDKLFSSYKQMHHVLIECADQIKKTSKKDLHMGRNRFYELIRETNEADMVEWTSRERAENMQEVFGSIDVMALIEPQVIEKLAEKGIVSIDALEENKKDLVWFVSMKQTPKKTKNGKKYLLMEVLGPTGKPTRLMCWGWKDKVFAPYTLCVAEAEKNDFGCSCMAWLIKEL